MSDDPFREMSLVSTQFSHKEMARVLWTKYTEWSEGFANGIMTLVRDGAGEVIPLDDMDLKAIEKHDQLLYKRMMQRAAELGIPDSVMAAEDPNAKP